LYGERVTVVEFESEEGLERWRVDPDHRAAKRHWLESFFSEFKFQICSVIRERVWLAKAPPDSPNAPEAAQRGRI
jgi:heme-degrading monooxygenase HmoA